MKEEKENGNLRKLTGLSMWKWWRII